jgi:hypothetical protein
LIDNWSTDGTVATVQHLLGDGIVGIERFPADGPRPHFAWKELLGRVEQLCGDGTIRADWFLHHDADEVRDSPWEGTSLREGFFRIDQDGYNCVDHTCIVFHPTGNDFTRKDDFGEYFRYFEFGMRPGHFVQRKAWKNLHRQVSLAESGGHDVQFEGRRIHPYKFLLRHYPIRSQMHGERKIIGERKPRWSPLERRAGWHTQYDHVEAGFKFVRDASQLTRFEEQDFFATYLFERLSGVGIVRDDKPARSVSGIEL